MDKEDLKEIDKITFGIYSAEEIEKFSVCKVTSTKLYSSEKNFGNMNGTVYDPRMGPFDNGIKCSTCSLSIVDCVGHFGSITLAEPVVHPLYYKQVISFLKCFCTKCFKLLITEDQINLNSFNKLKGIKRFNSILEKLDKVDICSHCHQSKPEIKFTINDSSISLVHKQKEGKLSIVLQADEIKKIFDNITVDDVRLLGFDPDLIQPKNMVITVFPVMPPSTRPYVIADGNICDDDLTYQLVEIIKANNHLESLEGVPNSETKRQKYIQSLKFRISTYYNNSSCRAIHSTNGRAMRGIKERLTGKNGMLRTNLMGKRVNQSGRTVVGGDPTLKMGQVAVPPEMACNLTVPVQVTNYNREYLQSIVNNNKANFVLTDGGKTRIVLSNPYSNALFFRGTILNHGDVIVRSDENGKETEIVVNNGRDMLKPGDRLKRNNVFVDKLEYPEKREYILNIGDIIERHLVDGDILLLNRQPTLHEGSMIAKEVVIKPGKTLRINLAITHSLNADFDGDEVNIHPAQSVESQTELRLLSATKHKIISAQGSKPNISIVQDSLLGAYLMSYGIKNIRKDQFSDISMKIDIPLSRTQYKILHIRKIMKLKGKKAQSFNGKGLISLLLPDDFQYEKKNNAHPNEPVVRIYKGVLYEGTFDKQILGAVSNSIIQILNKEYGPDTASIFVDGIQYITNAWLMIFGYSIGLGDCMVQNKEKESEIKDVVQKYYLEAEGIKNTTTHPGIKEVRITSALNKARDIGLRIAKDSLDPNNNFLGTIKSGSKGEVFNLMQITGLLGQQNLLGQRVKPTLNNGKRTLVHYSFDKLPLEMEYESRGFVSSSFIKGMSPREFYFHSMSGRESTCDTAMNTSTSGYIQRKIVKLTEDIKIQYDGTVRDEVGSIYNFAYGETNIDPKQMIKVDGNLEPFDIGSIINKLNMETKQGKKEM